MFANWALFLDRDGVINERLPGAYVRTPEEFEFATGALAAIQSLSQLFRPVVVVTNQQGIGKELMTEEELATVHQYMLQEVRGAGGRIDSVYYCPELATQPQSCRKPSPEMAFQAQQDYPEIQFERSVMVGDSVCDMEFGSRLGMYTVFITSKPGEELLLETAGCLVNARFSSLAHFAASLRPDSV
jgi:histidinol-phosphate phosphatase family protein